MYRTVYLANLTEIYKRLKTLIPDKDTGMFHHCMYSNKIHDTPEYNNCVVDLTTELGLKSGEKMPEDISKILAEFPITTGVCKNFKNSQAYKDSHKQEGIGDILRKAFDGE